jgi:DNA-binding PadR family transcriptional regulator
MPKNLLPSRQCRYDYHLQVLAYLAELKISTGQQIEKYCFHDASNGFAWRIIPKLRSAKLIEGRDLKLPGERRRSGFSLTKDGFSELKAQIQLNLDEIQIKSNTPYHDVVLSDLRIFFSRINECHYFITENILRSKILETAIPDLATFRSHRCDSAVYMSTGNNPVWLSLEYERTQKSYDRYVHRIRNWYQAENLPGILLITENNSLIELLSQIDRKTLPHLPRKILYLSKNNLQSSAAAVQFHNCNKDPLTFTLRNSMNIHYPILDQSFSKCRSEK